MNRYAMLMLLFVSLIGCAGNPGGDNRQTMPLLQPASDGPLPAEGLPSQQLDPGECGLFLWTMNDPRRFTFFSEARSGRALILHDGKTLELVQTDADGDLFGAFFTETSYLTPDGLWSTQLSLTPGDMLEDGQRIRSGRLVTRGVDGWETILPVTGVRACIPG